MLNLDELFRRTSTNQPRHPAIKSRRWGWISYKALNDAVESAAAVLERNGVGAGSTVGVHFTNEVEHILYNYAIWRTGGCVVPIPIELAAMEKQEICRRIAIDCIISAKSASLEFIAANSRDNAAPLPHDSVFIPLKAARTHPTGFSQINAAFIRFSSGTTGASKGVVLSHESIRDRFEAANEAFGLGPKDRVIWVLSMSYHFAVSICAYLSYGAAIVLPSNHWSQGIQDAIQQENGTFLYASPLHYAMLADAADAPPFTSLRLAVSTASSLNPLVASRFAARYGLPLTQALGIIEVGLPAVNVAFAAAHPEAVGRVLSNNELRLEDCGLGPRLGEVALSGKGMLDAYYDPWQLREEIMPDGWFRTGDIGELDDDGCLFIRGRTKDVINVAGMKVFPREIECVLESHPAVQDACAFAVPEPRCGEVPHACVVFKSSHADCRSTELVEFCKTRLAAHKVPRRIEIVAKLDRTASGKMRHPQHDAAPGRQEQCAVSGC